MKTLQSLSLAALACSLSLLVGSASALRAQDSMRGAPEPVDPTVDVSKLTYDYLVDGDLPQDDPAAKKFKTLQAAYAAAPAGTEQKPTVIGIKPNVYQLPGGAPRTPSMRIEKNWITFLGLTNNRRTVVLADNRGLFQGADDDGYILDVNDTGFSLRNLTVVNYCNNDYEYPGNPAKNLKKRSDVITQGVALQNSGDKHVYDNVALLGRLDTMFLRTARSYFRNVFIEGTDDWMGGGQISVWEDCTLIFPTGRGVMTASNVIFIRCKFEAARGFGFYKAEYRSADRPDVLIDGTFPVNSPSSPVAWVRGKAAPRPPYYTPTWHNKDVKGNPIKPYDATVGSNAPTYEYGREMSEAERAAYNPWNLLRAAPGAATPDDWDPAGVRAKYENAGSLPFRVALSLQGDQRKGGLGTPAIGTPTIRTGGAGATFSAAVTPARADQTVTWVPRSGLVTLSNTSGPKVTVTGNNTTGDAQWVGIDARASDGCYATAWVYVEPKFIAPPAVTRAPVIKAPSHGEIAVDYALDLGGRADQSLVSWWICDDASGANPRPVAVSRGNVPAKTLTLIPGYAGKYLKVGIKPKHSICDAGPEVTAMSAQPVAAADVRTSPVSPDFRTFVSDTNETYVSGLWTIVGTWLNGTGDNLYNGYGIHPTTPGLVLYQNDADTGDMQIDLVMTPEKTEGTGFSIPGSPADTAERSDRNLHGDIYIKYDPRTKTGYTMRYWRTTQSSAACMYQFFSVKDGVSTPIDQSQILSGVFKQSTHMTVKATGKMLSVTATNTADGQTLKLETPYTPNRFGGGGVSWPRGSTNIYSKIEVTYPGAAKN